MWLIHTIPSESIIWGGGGCAEATTCPSQRTDRKRPFDCEVPSSASLASPTILKLTRWVVWYKSVNFRATRSSLSPKLARPNQSATLIFLVGNSQVGNSHSQSLVPSLRRRTLSPMNHTASKLPTGPHRAPTSSCPPRRQAARSPIPLSGQL